MKSDKHIGADKREAILDVAENLFADFGFEAVSIRQLAKEADINVAMVSYYFGSKEQLYKAVIERKMINTTGFVASNPNMSHWEKLETIGDNFVDAFFSRRKFQQIIFREMALNQRTEITDILVNHMQNNFRNVSGIIRDGIEKGVFRKVDVELTVMTMIGITKTFSNNSQLACHIMKEASADDMFSDKYRRRLKLHVKDFFRSHLKPDAI